MPQFVDHRFETVVGLAGPGAEEDANIGYRRDALRLGELLQAWGVPEVGIRRAVFDGDVGGRVSVEHDGSSSLILLLSYSLHENTHLSKFASGAHGRTVLSRQVAADSAILGAGTRRTARSGCGSRGGYATVRDKGAIMSRKKAVSKKPESVVGDYPVLLAEVKERIREAQYAALKTVNTELVGLYWDIGRMIVTRQAEEGWGKAVVEQLSSDIQSAFPGVGGFSTSNLWRMRAFFDAYSRTEKLAPPVREISWTHNVLIVERCENARRASATTGCTNRLVSPSGNTSAL